MSEEERGEVLAFVDEHFPFISEELEQLRRRQIERFERRIRQITPEMRELMDMTEINPRRARLAIEERRADMLLRLLTFKYRAAEPDRRDALRAEMKAISARLFDARQERQEGEIRELEERIEELRRRHADAAKRREAIVEDQISKRLEKPPFPDDMPPPRFRDRGE
jgi:hypothetical protein